MKTNPHTRPNPPPAPPGLPPEQPRGLPISRIAGMLALLLLLVGGLPPGVRAANIDLGGLYLDDFAPRSVRPGSTNESVVWSILNVGPSPVGSARASLGFWQTTKGDLLLRWTFSKNDVLGDAGDVVVEQPRRAYLSELGILTEGYGQMESADFLRGFIETSYASLPGLVIPALPEGDYRLFLTVLPPPGGSLVETLPSDNSAMLDGFIQVTSTPGEGALRLDGVDDYATATDSLDFEDQFAFEPVHDLLVEAWIKADGPGTLVEDDAFRLEITSATGSGSSASPWVPRFTVFGADGSSGEWLLTSSDAVVRAGEWTHLSFGYQSSAGTVTAAVGGRVLADSRKYSPKAFRTNSLPLVVGRRQTAGGAFAGFIDELTLGTRKPSSTNFVPARRARGTDAVALYHFDGVTASSEVADSFMGRRPLTLQFGAHIEPATVEPPPPPSITRHPLDLTVRAGNPAEFSVAATGSNPLTYQWFKGGTALANATNATFILSAAQPADAGSYLVEVRNAVGAARSRAASLTVGQSPVIVSHPSSQSGLPGGTVTFRVAATGTEPLTYGWTFNGAALADGPGVSGSATATLTLASVSAASEGSYAVRVSNAYGSQTSKTAKLTLTTPPTPPPVRLWLDDAFPAGWQLAVQGAGAWTFVDSPDAISGNAILVSDASDGFHQIYGDLAATAVTADDELVASVYLDPANPPRMVMLQWYDAQAGWNHRAYWGETPDWALHLAGSPSAVRMGSLPPTGHWIRLRVPATTVDLAGRTVQGLALSLTGGQASWDAIGLRGVAPLYWLDDTYPSPRPADTHADGTWEFVTQPTPVSGSKSLRSDLNSGFHQVYGDLGPQATTVLAADLLVASVYLDPISPPRTVMLQWHEPLTGWNHRAFWGETPDWAIPHLGSAAATFMGPLPPTGSWVQLRVPALAVDLAGRSLDGFALTLAGGRAHWDAVGLAPGRAELWIDDSLPAGAAVETQGAGPWRFVTAPSPVSGRVGLLSDRTPGFHQMYGTLGSAAPTLASGDHLVASVYLDPINPPRMVMMQWYDPADGWTHRAFWGDVPDWAAPLLGTSAARRVGPLPPIGRWVGLSVPVESVGLAGRTAQGFALSLTDGMAVFDAVGLLRPAARR